MSDIQSGITRFEPLLAFLLELVCTPWPPPQALQSQQDPGPDPTPTKSSRAKSSEQLLLQSPRTLQSLLQGPFFRSQPRQHSAASPSPATASSGKPKQGGGGSSSSSQHLNGSSNGLDSNDGSGSSKQVGEGGPVPLPSASLSGLPLAPLTSLMAAVAAVLPYYCPATLASILDRWAVVRKPGAGVHST